MRFLCVDGTILKPSRTSWRRSLKTLLQFAKRRRKSADAHPTEATHRVFSRAQTENSSDWIFRCK
uniref:Uncharacterized protein LOC114331775 isoform X5 n=1 Tax=Diabrotica virgifera virgifera TaxID=50390 RepID=A0A6P7FWD2_DIAVI